MKKIKGIILYIVALFLCVPLTIINFILVLSKYGSKWSVVDGFLFQSARDIDVFANHNFRTLWNATLIIKEGYEFGTKGETVSYTLGINQRDHTLTRTGMFLVLILDLFDRNHCLKAIEK